MLMTEIFISRFILKKADLDFRLFFRVLKFIWKKNIYNE